MDTTTEIRELDQKIAANEGTIEATARLREQRDRLTALDEAEQEHRRLVAEKQKAVHAVREAESEARRAEAAPLRAELSALDRPLAAIEEDVAGYLHQAIADARVLHARYVEALAARNAVAHRLNALGDHTPHAPVLAFEAFVRLRIRKFDDAGRTASGAGWARTAANGR